MKANINSIIGIVMGFISLGLSFFYAFPQLIKLCKTRNSSGISLTSYIIYLTDSIIWTIWACGFFIEQSNMFNPISSGDPLLFKWSLIPAIILDTFDILIMGFIISFKINHLLICKKNHLTELQLSSRLIHKYNNHIRCFWPVYLCVLFCIGIILTVSLSITYLAILSNAGNEFLWVLIINLIASIGWEAFYWPQFIKTIKIKDTSGISLFWSIFLFISCIFTFFYDLSIGLNNQRGFNWSTIGGLIFSGIIPTAGFLIIKIMNIARAKKLKLSEVEFIKKIYKCK